MFRFWTSQGFGKFGLVSWRSTYSSCGFYSSSRIFLSQTSLVPTVLLVNLQGPPDIEKTQLAKIHGPGPVGPGHVYECGGSRLWEGGSGSAWIATSEHVFLHGTTPSLFESKELIKWQFQKWYHHRALCPKVISFFLRGYVHSTLKLGGYKQTLAQHSQVETWHRGEWSTWRWNGDN